MFGRRPRDAEFEQFASKAFAFISARSAPSISHSEYDAHAFGNACVELTGDGLRVRVTRDRSQLFVDLAPLTNGDWVDEEVVLRVVGAHDEAHALVNAGWRDIDASALAIARHLKAIVARFAPDNWPATRAELAAEQQRRGSELFGNPIDT